MDPRVGPTEIDRRAVGSAVLGGLASREEPSLIMRKLADFHPKHNTFPGEELLELAADAIEESGASRVNRIDYEGIRERNLTEFAFSGKSEHHKSHFALRAAAMIRAGVDPDLLAEVSWWNTDDFWVYCFYALLAYVREAADRTDRSTEAVAKSIATRRGLDLVTQN
jgi:hypothetical protein